MAKIILYSADMVEVTSESFENDKKETVEFVKIQTIKVKKGVPQLSYVTFGPEKFKDLIASLASKIKSV